MNDIFDVINHKDESGRVQCLEFLNKNGNVVKNITLDFFEEYKRNEDGFIQEYQDSTGYKYKMNKTINEVNEEFKNNKKSFLGK